MPTAYISLAVAAVNSHIYRTAYLVNIINYCAGRYFYGTGI